MSWSTRFISLKVFVTFSIFDSVTFLLKFIFLFDKMHGLWLKTYIIIPFKIKIIEKLYTVFLPNLWFLSCNIKKLKFIDICVRWSSPKTYQEKKFLKLFLKFWERQYFSIVTFKLMFDIFLLINLFNWTKEHILKHQIKKHRCKFEKNKITYSKS